MRAYVGITDQSWYEFLRARPHLDEVNFWKPGGGGFQAIGSGEPFLFKTHSPSNLLVGGGFLSSSTRLKISEAWEIFGEANGVDSLDTMRARISHYRRHPLAADDDPEIGCVLLRDVFFVAESHGEPAPHDWGRGIMQGKTYDLSAASHVEDAIERLLLANHIGGGPPAGVPGPMFGDPRFTLPRLGQKSFKAMVLAAYQRRCAITGAKIAPTLDAAHIRPVALGGPNLLSNGMLLRSDVHTMFDEGFLGIDPSQRALRVSPRLRSDFGNGDEFYAREGQKLLVLPTRPADRPQREALVWHMDEVFKSA